MEQKDHNKGLTYEQLGVSHQKEEVHIAIKEQDHGLFPDAFCKIIPDPVGEKDYCAIMHADGAGTKSIIAYMMYKETGDPNYFKGIVQDAVVMNIDDMLCAGIDGTSHLLLSNTIGRNKKLIDGKIIATIINAYDEFLLKLRKLGLSIYSTGGETADLGDLVRTIVVDCTVFGRLRRDRVISSEKIRPGDVIVGLSSFGKTTYEDIAYNSGIGSNGLTLARHALLSHEYYHKYPETYSPELDESLIYRGEFSLHDKVPGIPLTIGEAILSPTRTYTPLLLNIFDHEHARKNIHAIFHNTGGGQTKCLRFGKGLHYIKDNLFDTPPFFKLIQESGNIDWKEMYSVFNMGHRMEIICNENFANEFIIPAAKVFGIDAKIVGHVEKSSNSETNQLTIENSYGNFSYSLINK